MIFRLEAIAKEFSGNPLFGEITVQCNPGDRIGLIGRNGSGKTTLLDIVQGRVQPDAGQVHRSGGLSLARVEQLARFQPGTSVREEALLVFQNWKRVEQRLQQLEAEIARSHQVGSDVAEEYERLRLRLHLHGGYDYEARTEAVLNGLGLGPHLGTPCSRLSGGQQSRLLLAKALLTPADLLLLDEPTNHLDIDAILYVAEYLNGLSSAFLLISHDRAFLDQTTSRTWEIEAGTLHDYPGSFSAARQLREERLERRRKEFQRQQEWKENLEDYVRRNIAGQKTKQAQSRRKVLEKTEWLENPEQSSPELHLRIRSGSRGGAFSFRARGAVVGYPQKVLIKDLELQIQRGDRIGIVGGNGSGKTTLVRSLLGDIPLLGGTVELGFNSEIAYFSQEPELGDQDQTVYDFLRGFDTGSTDLELRSFAALFLFRGEDIFKPLRALSGGERSRLALARLLFRPANVILMDEPTNHLDIPSREALEEALTKFDGSLIVISHDQYFLNRVVDQLYLIRDQRLHRIDDLAALRGAAAPAPARPSRVAESSPEPSRAPAALSKNERQRRERKLQELEERVHGLERRKQEVLERLQSGGCDFAELQDLSLEHERLGAELDQLYRQWENAAAELVE